MIPPPWRGKVAHCLCSAHTLYLSPERRENPPRRWGKGLKSKPSASTAVLRLLSGLSWWRQEPPWATLSQIKVLWGGDLRAPMHLCWCCSERSATSSSLAPKIRLPWHIRAARLAARGRFPLGSVPMAYEAPHACVCQGAQPCLPILGGVGGWSGGKDEEFRQGLT